MSLDNDSVLRPSDYEYIRAQSAQLRRTAGVPVVFAGLREGRGVRVTISLGHRTAALRTIHVTPSRGLGGLSWRSRGPMIVRDYGASSEITHDFDEQILGEGITDLAAAPFIVDGDVRGLIYAGDRGERCVGERSVDQLVRQANSISTELSTRDEVDRRVAALVARDKREVDVDRLTRWQAQLGSIAADSTDPLTKQRLEALIVSATRSSPPRVALTRRQLQVLSLVELGFSNREAASRLGLTTETVKTYLRAAMVRLGARSRQDAVIKAQCAGHILR